MSDTSAGLPTLHLLHRRLQEAIDDLASGPRQLAARQSNLQKKKKELDDRKARLKQLRAGVDQKNLQLKTSEVKIADFKAKLNAVANNREYEILRNAIEADTTAKSVLEDEIIEALDGVDVAQQEIKAIEAEIAKHDADLAKVTVEVNAREPEQLARRDDLQKQVGAAEKFLPAAVGLDYRRLVEAHGADALAPVENEACSNCYVQMTRQQLMELRAGKVMFCRNCHRLLYLAAKP